MDLEYLKSEVNNAQFNFEEFKVSYIRSLIELVEIQRLEIERLKTLLSVHKIIRKD